MENTGAAVRRNMVPRALHAHRLRKKDTLTQSGLPRTPRRLRGVGFPKELAVEQDLTGSGSITQPEVKTEPKARKLAPHQLRLVFVHKFVDNDC